VLGEDLTPRGLRRALAVDVGGVEERDAGVGKSGAEGDDGHLQVGGAEGAVTHGVLLWVVNGTGWRVSGGCRRGG